MAAEVLRRLIRTSETHQIAWIARDGAEAVKLCERDLPGLVLMDLMMPYMDGAEATGRIMSATPCPILIVTATVGGNAAKVFAALGAGAIDAIDTPTVIGLEKTGRAYCRRSRPSSVRPPGKSIARVTWRQKLKARRRNWL